MRSANRGGESLFTIDASVWVNAYSPAEPGQPESRAFLEAVFARGDAIVVPTLLVVELSGVISRTRGDAALAGQMTIALLALPMIRWIALDGMLARQAADLAAAHRLRGADAVYAAVAVTYRSDLVSLDREHLTRLTAVVPTTTPGMALSQFK